MKKDINKREYGISTLKGLIGAIPFAGTFLNEIAFEARSRIKQERVNKFIEEFSNYISNKNILEQKLDFSNAEKIGDVFEEIIISVSKSSAQHKINIFKKILYEQFKTSHSEIDDIMRYISITNNISSIQFNILSSFGLLSDSILKYKIQILELEAEKEKIIDEINTMHVEYKNEKMDILRERLEKIPKLIKKKKSALQRGNINPNSHKTFNIYRSTYIAEVQDLIAKGLLFDFAIRTSLIKPYVAFGITQLGRSYLDYINNV